MYKVMKDNKIISVLETNIVVGLNYDTIEQDTEHNVDDYDQYNGEYLLKSEIPKPSHDEQSEKRAFAYRQEVDPITAHIQRLRDVDPVPQDEIDELIAERDAKVDEIKQRYPYPTDLITQ